MARSIRVYTVVMLLIMGKIGKEILFQLKKNFEFYKKLICFAGHMSCKALYILNTLERIYNCKFPTCNAEIHNMYAQFLLEDREWLTITRLTSETAFRVMCHQYIRPPMLTTIIVIVITTTMDENTSRPISRNVTTKIAARDTPMLNKVSGHVVRYCS